MNDLSPTDRRDAILTCVSAVTMTLICAALLMGAALAPAPAAVVPLVVLVGLGVPMAAAASVPPAVAVLRYELLSVRRLRRQLAEIPEVQHPKGW